jgi:capsular polysaccharide biosynthesis protein
MRRRGATPVPPSPRPSPTIATAKPPSKLDQIWDLVQAEDWPAERPIRAFFDLVLRAVIPNAEGKVLVAAGPQADVYERIIASMWAAATVVVAREGEDESAAHARLSAAAPFDVVLHAADVEGTTQALMFRRVFMHLREGGIYLSPRMVTPDPNPDALTPPTHRIPLPNEDWVPEPHFDGDVWTLVSEAMTARLQDFRDHSDRSVLFRDVIGLGRHLAEVQVFSKMLWIKNQLRSQPKLTEFEADIVLAQRPEFGAEISCRPPAILTARAAYKHNLEHDPYFSPDMRAPKLTLRRYVRPICSRGQIVTSGGLLWPDTFRHHLYPRLTNTYVEESAPRFGYVRRDTSEAVDLPGAWFHLDSEWPGHFGHLMTEQMGRLWAWEEVRRREPDVKLLLTVQHDRSPAVLHPFEVDLLAAFGITEEDVHVFERPCRPETLYSATSMFSSADYVHPDIVEVWAAAGDVLAAAASDSTRPSRIFCTRAPSLKRSCRNTSEVEDLFRRHGFEIVRTEEHTLADQVAMFRAASAVAGFAGSALFTLAFCPTPKPVYLVGPTAYTARNEHLICAVHGHPLVTAWSPSELDHPHDAWTQAAFSAGFTMNLADEGRFLEKHLKTLG